MKINKLPILSQLLLFILPLVALIICISFFFQYHDILISQDKQEEQRRDNIKNGMKLFIDNHDLSLKLLENELDKRVRYLNEIIINKHQVGLNNSNLDSLRQVLKMDKKHEDLYIIDRNGIVVNTTKMDDLGLNFFEFGESYKTFLEDVWNKKTLVIERVATENTTKLPRKYSYQAIDENYILEIGIRYKSVNSLVVDFSSKINFITKKYSNIQSIGLFAATEALPPRISSASINENVKPIALQCIKNKKDTFSISITGGEIVKTDFIYLEMRSSAYFKGYVLQIISDNSLKRALFLSEFKKFLFVLISMLLLIAIGLYVVAKRITQPIRYLVDKVSIFTLTDGITEIKVKGNKEINFLGDEFNKLFEEINNNKTYLEQRIKERTNELNTQNKQLEKLSEERGLLMQEIHHRVKNNLQIISSLLNLQASKVNSQEAIEALDESKNRVQAMALLHDELYKDSNFVTINANTYIQNIVNALKDTIRKNVTITVNTSNVMFNSSESISIGLITNEAITNALKHAFEEDAEGLIDIEANQTTADVILKIFNNGKKIINTKNLEEKESLRLTIIGAFSEKLEGKYTFENVEGGVLLTVIFPKKHTSEFQSS